MPFSWLIAIPILMVCSGLAACAAPPGAEWSGPFNIAPVSAPDMLLEAVGGGTADGTIVSIGSPNGRTNQRWVVEPKADGLYVIRASYSQSLVLAAKGGGKDNGTQVVLEADAGQPWQRWTIKRHRFNGSVGLVPQHAPNRGLDDFGGGKKPGDRQDLWEYIPTDEHLQWTLKPLAGATYPKDLPRPGVIKQLSFSESRIFPGTNRGITVFIPAEYDGSKPACVYVRQDGYSPAEKGMIEALIAGGDMPVTVGVFVTPGDMPAPMPDAMGRRNRGLEYDGMGDLFVRFLTEEVLPFVAKQLDLKLSDSGKDRCIAGGSSGGIAAFNAAWERPDAFSRVYANSGSFVAFRGGHEFPTLVRKTEAKPIRAYLTTGMHDMENAAGDWYLLDQEMDKALRFSGYEYEFHAIDGPHVAGWNEHFAPAMKFIWKGWPEPVHAGPSAPRVQDIIQPGQRWEPVAGSFGDARCAASNSKGEVYYLDAAANRIGRIGLDGKIAAFLADAGHADGLTVGPKDEIYTVSEASAKVMRYEPDGRAAVVAEGVKGRGVVATHDGALYVTGAAPNPADGSAVWRVKDGKVTLVDTGLKHATALAIRPDQWLLQVADGGSKWVYSYRIKPDGTLGDKERYFCLHVADHDDDAGPTAIGYTREGKMLVATRMGIQGCADDGPTQIILPMPDRVRVLGLCLGGPERSTLYAFCGGKVWRRAVKVHGVGAYSPWQGMPGSPL